MDGGDIMKIKIGSKLDLNAKLSLEAEKVGDKVEQKRLRKERRDSLDVYDGPIFGRDSSTMSDEILAHELLWANKNNDSDNENLVSEAVRRGWEVSK